MFTVTSANATTETRVRRGTELGLIAIRRVPFAECRNRRDESECGVPAQRCQLAVETMLYAECNTMRNRRNNYIYISVIYLGRLILYICKKISGIIQLKQLFFCHLSQKLN